jgi:hypothetical protein
MKSVICSLRAVMAFGGVDSPQRGKEIWMESLIEAIARLGRRLGAWLNPERPELALQPVYVRVRPARRRRR